MATIVKCWARKESGNETLWERDMLEMEDQDDSEEDGEAQRRRRLAAGRKRKQRQREAADLGKRRKLTPSADQRCVRVNQAQFQRY